MDESLHGYRRSRPSPRPESSASGQTKMTPTSSSNGSSINFNTGGKVASGASLLHDRLRDRKVESARQARRRSVDMNSGGVPSSPMAVIGDRRPSSSGKGMGVKQVEEHVSTLTKQNFNLKLELHHRRERQTELEARLETAEKALEEAAELRELNDQLLAELEKRDQAVEEAVGIIVGLEEKVDTLMKEREVVRNFDVNQPYDSGYFRSSHGEDLPSSPPLIEQKKSQALTRMPSFLSEQSEGAEVLKSLYLPHNQTYSEATLPHLVEEEASDGGINSPRLSMLSESSFVSIYGQKNASPEAEEEEETPQRRHRASSSVEKWIGERPVPVASTAAVMVRGDLRKNHFRTIDDVIESPLQKLEKLRHTLERNQLQVVTSRRDIERRASNQEPGKPKESLRRLITDKSSFDHQQGLPPTPDTISTSTLRHYQNSNDTLAQTSNNEAYLRSTSKLPSQPFASFNAYQSAISIRPRSAGETITSRREGHGWDTDTQGDFSSNASTFSAEQFSHPKRPESPDLFSFNTRTITTDDRSGDWGRDVLFNNAEPHLPSLPKSSRYDNVRRQDHAEHPRSDDTVTNGNYGGVQYGIAALDASIHRDPPARRSSLNHALKLGKSSLSSGSGSGSGSSGQATAGSSLGSAKKKGFAGRIFGRSETSPSLSAYQQPDLRSPTMARAHYFASQGGQEDDRATPPPIKRSRDPNVQNYRPSSAGGLNDHRSSAHGHQLRRMGALGDASDGPQEAGESDKQGGRKWLGFGRSNSLRRT